MFGGDGPKHMGNLTFFPHLFFKTVVVTFMLYLQMGCYSYLLLVECLLTSK